MPYTITYKKEHDIIYMFKTKGFGVATLDSCLVDNSYAGS